LLEAFENGRDLAIGETDLPEQTFPVACPYSSAEILDSHFYPTEPSQQENLKTQ
jgi:Domain of unknown function DUF29